MADWKPVGVTEKGNIIQKRVRGKEVDYQLLGVTRWVARTIDSYMESQFRNLPVAYQNFLRTMDQAL